MLSIYGEITLSHSVHRSCRLQLEIEFNLDRGTSDNCFIIKGAAILQEECTFLWDERASGHQLQSKLRVVESRPIFPA